MCIGSVSNKSDVPRTMLFNFEHTTYRSAGWQTSPDPIGLKIDVVVGQIMLSIDLTTHLDYLSMSMVVRLAIASTN